MQRKRTVHLNLLTIKFPVTAIVSILHRISGVFLFLLLPVLLGLLQQSLRSSDAFMALAQWIEQAFWLRFMLWITISSLIVHWIAGIRHMVMDWGVGETLFVGKVTGWFVIALSMGLIIFIGFKLW